jgi:hypothetical protein
MYTYIIDINQKQNQMKNSSSNQSEMKGIKMCYFRDNEARIVYWMGFANLTLVIFGLNNILTLILIYRIYESRNRLSIDQKTRNTEIRDRKFALNSIGLNILCFICKAPLLTFLAISIDVYLTPNQTAMFFVMFVTFFTIYNGSAFYLNLFVNSIFMDEVKVILGIKNKNNHSIFIYSTSLKSITKSAYK